MNDGKKTTARTLLFSNGMNETEEYKTEESEGNDGEPMASLVKLRKLTNEEFILVEERQQLVALKKELCIKVKEKCEVAQKTVQKLKDEVSELRQQCEELKGAFALRRSV